MTNLLLHRGASVNLHSETGLLTDTPLKVAIMTRSQDLVQLLLSAGADVNDLGSIKEASALTIAARTGHLQLVQLLLHAHADVNARLEGAITALQAAAVSGDINVVQLLLSYGADVNATHDQGHTAIVMAARSDNVEITETLLSHGAIDVVSALEAAGESRCYDVVSHLVRSRMKSHATPGHAFGGAALRAATECDNFELVQLVFSWGADVNGDTNCLPALLLAANNANIKLVRLLMDHGANVNAICQCQCNLRSSGDFVTTALQAAVNANDVQNVKLLLHSGAHVNVRATTGSETALVAAARQRNLEIFQLLLEFGADIKTQGAAAVAAVVNPDENTTSTNHTSIDQTVNSASPSELLSFILQGDRLAGPYSSEQLQAAWGPV